MTKDNAAAADLWSQMFERLAAHPWACVADPEYDEGADYTRFREGMVAAGWSKTEIDAIDEQRRAWEGLAPVTSPGANRSVEAILAWLADDVEAAMDRLGLHSHAWIARGVEPRVTPLAAKTGVIMTDESIITVGSFLFRFCGLVARAFTRTLRLNPWLWEPDSYTQEAGIALLRLSPEVIGYWMKIYLSFATTGTNFGVPFRPSTKEEVMLMEQVARAMEIFAVAHEYGHHHLAHGRDVEADPHVQEFEADQFALRICDEVDRRPIVLENPYLVSGAGGVVLLMALETLRSVELVMGAPPPRDKSHPPISDRIVRFDAVRLLKPAEFKRLRGFRLASARIMELVHNTILPTLATLPPPLLAEMRRFREQINLAASQAG